MVRLKLPTLLLITQNPSIRGIVKRELSASYFLIEAAHPFQAFQTIRSTQLDFIVLDSSLPDTDPLELVRELHFVSQSLVPILFITGRLNRSFLEKATDAGVTDFLSDPLDKAELQSRIEQVQKRSAMRDKTTEIASTIKPIPFSSSSLKPKLVLHGEPLRLLAQARASRKPLPSLIFSQSDSVSTLLQPHLKSSDPLIPLPDGQLLVLLPDRSLDEAEHLAETIRAHFIRLKLPISIAVSSLKGNEEGFYKAIESAVKAFKQTPPHTIFSLETP